VRTRSTTPRPKAEEEFAEARLDPRLDDLSGRTDRVERLLIKLTGK
jgi:hypothetical protein